jgi:hypothetical protein
MDNGFVLIAERIEPTAIIGDVPEKKTRGGAKTAI